MKTAIKNSLVILGMLLLLILGLSHASTKLTFLEYTNISDRMDLPVTVDSDGTKLSQSFTMPYDILDSFSIRIGTFGKDNNSTWLFSLYDNNGSLIYQDRFNASGIEDNSFYRIELDNRLRVNKGDEYSFSIFAENVSPLTQLTFYTSADDGSMCCRVYGGDTDIWWYGLTIFMFVYGLLIVVLLFVDNRKQIKYRDDNYLLGMLSGIVVFLLLCTFARISSFCDEYDNIRGGMVIANGGVLYRDYITQHMPVMYYLCALFAKLGASSVEQFRLSYYILESIIWCLLFIRHSKHYGIKKMFILPITECIFTILVVYPYGNLVFAECFQGLIFTVLMLEFIRYSEDLELNWTRCIIVSVCIWASLGTTFLSVYPLSFLTILFLYLEIRQSFKNKSNLKSLLNRYYKLAATMAIPPVAAFLYFNSNHALRAAYEQFYLFNREVYPHYIDGYGKKLLQPLIDSIYYFFGIFSNVLNDLITAKATEVDIIRIVLLVITVAIIGKMFEKKLVIEGLSLSLMMLFSASRSFEAHGLAAWYISMLIICLYADLYKDRLKAIGIPAIVMVLIVLSGPFFIKVRDNLMYEQPSITDLENKVIELTQDDEDQRIYIDAFCFDGLCPDSLYLAYKGRDNVNPAVFMLPWYMDWYEQRDVDALLTEQPRVVIYDPERVTWSYDHYNNTFDELVNKSL